MKRAILLSVLSGTILFSSCEKNLYDENQQPQGNPTIADLIVPENFDWSMTQNVECTVTSDVTTNLSIYLDENCSENKLLTTFSTEPDAGILPLSVPTYATQVYIQYETTGGNKTVASVPVSSNGTIQFNVPTNAKPTITTRTVGNGNGKPDGNGVIYYPNSGWGTIMFEDMFPKLGDYDFNDFVMDYVIQLYNVQGKNKKYTTDYMAIGLRLRAIGGMLPYSPFLRLTELDKNLIESVTAIMGEDEVEIKMLEKDGKAVLDLSPLINNLSKPQGSKYFNTEKDFIVPYTDLPLIQIEISLNTRVKIADYLLEDMFDFYLAQKNGTEIHMNGYAPVFYEYPFENEALLPVNGNNENYYFDTKRLIWGFKIPGVAAHAIESANFRAAYKNFEKWAVSGGQNSSNWFDQGNIDKDLLIEY